MSGFGEIFVIGETFLDSFNYYKSSRSDPADDNAPVCTITDDIIKDDSLGGAGNFANQLSHLVNSEGVIRFYTSSTEKILTKHLSKNICQVTSIGNKQAIKSRIYVNDEYLLRMDSNDRLKVDNEDRISLIRNLIETNRLLSSRNIIVISNYHKGLLHDSNIEEIVRDYTRNKDIYVVDTNIISESYSGVDVLKINKKTAGDYCGWSMEVEDFASYISDKLSIKDVVITLGEEGYVHFNKSLNRTIVNRRNGNPNFKDASGAGDSFFAGLVYGLWKDINREVSKALDIADRLAYLSVQNKNTSYYVNENQLQ